MNQSTTVFLSIRRQFIGLVLVLSCAGCVVAPIGMFSEAPYRPEVLQKLSRKDAGRNLVRQTLGSPKAVKSGGKYWFYASRRETWGIIGGTSSAVLEDFEWVAVQFDDADQVTFMEHNDDLHGCLSNGICQFGGLFSTQPSQAIMSAPKVEDDTAKAYQARAGECTVYLFLDSLPWPLVAGIVKFSIDGQSLGILNDQTYLFLTHPHGEISISAYQFEITTKCQGGEKLYVKAVKAKDWSWETGEDLAPVQVGEGEAAIRTRRLALPD